jgi:hypothetical protein
LIAPPLAAVVVMPLAALAAWVRDELSRHFSRNGGLLFFRFGRFGGSVYLARAPK